MFLRKLATRIWRRTVSPVIDGLDRRLHPPVDPEMIDPETGQPYSRIIRSVLAMMDDLPEKDRAAIEQLVDDMAERRRTRSQQKAGKQ